MRFFFRWRLFLITLFIAFILSGISLLFLNRFADLASSAHRDQFLIFLAQRIEDRLEKDSTQNPLQEKGPNVERLENENFPPDPPPERNFENKGFPPGPPPPHGKRDFLMWLTGPNGEVLYKNTDQAFPIAWDQLPRPEKVHEVLDTGDFFRILPAIELIKLNRPTETYLVVINRRGPPGGKFIGSKAIFLLLIITIAFSFSLLFVFWYLKRKSLEVRFVLNKLAQGDLKARLPLKKFDEFSGLMGEFNEMAEQIEALVARLRQTEMTRRTLLQELGHDLRTPLTSLKLAVDTLLNQGSKIDSNQSKELFGILEQDIDYIDNLLGHLVFLGTIEEPGYGGNRDKVSIKSLFEPELAKRNTHSKISWKFEGSDAVLLGDSSLFKRLFINGLDNASRFAKGKVTVKVSDQRANVMIEIIDDGSGLTEQELKNFGQRQGFQSRSSTNGKHSHFGSLIMNKIAKFYGGTVQIMNFESQGQVQGAILRIVLPKN